MIIHLYAQSWNDEWILPFFFAHYHGLVDRFFFFDDGSTDNTRTLLECSPNVSIERFARTDPNSFVLSEQWFSNECWKRSRGMCDWVIVTDLDEFLVHPSLREYLEQCVRDGLTLIPALGFQMISERRPQSGENLVRDYTRGAPWEQMMKPSIFDPEAIDEIRFTPGRHKAEPVGRVQVPRIDELMLLHYKYLGYEETVARHEQLRRGLGPTDLEGNWGHKYSWSREQLKADWDRVSERAVDTSTLVQEPAKTYPHSPWWDRYRE